MANRSQPGDELNRLKAENMRLKAENKKLKEQANEGNRAHPSKNKTGIVRQTSIIVFSILATLLLFGGNILFWTGNTVVKTDRYVDAVEPLIRQEEIQTAVATYASDQLFQNVDVEQIAEEALPPRAAFLAPTLSDQVQQNSQKVIAGILKNPKFQEKWNTVQANAHTKFINQVKQNGSDGSIDLSELYTQQISPQLKETKLAFLADKPLPDKVGSIKIVEGQWLSKLETVINNIDTWRTLAILLLIAFSALAVWLSKRRRKTLVRLSLFFSASMFLTLIGIRLSREIAASKVDAQYADAASKATQTILHPLAIQTATILVLGLLVAFVAWVSGPSRGACRVKELVQVLLSGKAHHAIFKNENIFTLWMGRNIFWLRWAVITIVAIILLLIRVTPQALLIASIVAIFSIFLLEILSGKPPREDDYG